MKTRILAIALLASLLPAACGRFNEGDGDGPTAGGIDHPTRADELVLRIEHVGGFVPVEFNLRAVPSLSIYGDGRMIVDGPVIEIYPGPAVPNLLQSRIDEAGLQAILEAARDAGLLRGDADLGFPCIADAATTRFTVVAEGRTHTVSAYALEIGYDGGTPECPGVSAAELEARSALADFAMKMGDLRSWLPEGSLGEEEPYTASEMRVFAADYRPDPELPQDGMRWPLGGELGRFGGPVENLDGTRCGVVSGDDLDALLPHASAANQLTPWSSGGGEFSLIFRPLLPDEHGC